MVGVKAHVCVNKYSLSLIKHLVLACGDAQCCKYRATTHLRAISKFCRDVAAHMEGGSLPQVLKAYGEIC